MKLKFKHVVMVVMGVVVTMTVIGYVLMAIVARAQGDTHWLWPF